MPIAIKNLTTGETATIDRDVRTTHPDWIHEQTETASESELQHFLDQLYWKDYIGRDDTPVADSTGITITVECECTACECTDIATTTDDSGTPVCGACSDYRVDDEGEVICSKGGDPDEQIAAKRQAIADAGRDPQGNFCVYWETVGDDASARTRYGTYESAEAACALAQGDFDAANPGGGGVTYLCGFSVRELVDGKWSQSDNE